MRGIFCVSWLAIGDCTAEVFFEFCIYQTSWLSAALSSSTSLSISGGGISPSTTMAPGENELKNVS